MQIKKRYFVVALVLLLGLTTFSFANPKEEMGSKKTAKGISETVTNDIKENNSYSEALEAVEVAEENPTEETVEVARNEIRNANNATEEQVQNLQQRVDVVEETIDVAALVKEVETLAEVKETREQAKAKYSNAETEVNKLDEGDVKDNLENRLAKVSRLLNDTIAPKITGVDENKPTNKNEIIYISDEFLTSVTINGTEYTEKDFTVADDLLKFEKKVTKEGTHTVIALDKLGNESTKTFVIDKTVAEVEVSKSNNDKSTNKDVTVTLKTNEKIVTPEGWTVVTEGTEFTKVYSENGKHTLTVKDLAGNETEVKFEVKRIDKVAPEATVTKSNNDKSTNQDVVVTLVANEAIYKPEGWTEVKTNKEHEFTKVYSENGKYEVVITDKAGNKSTIKFEVKRIDKVAPEATVTKSNNDELTNQDVVVTLVANEAIKNPKGWTEVKTNKEHEFTKVYSENGLYELTIKDKAGNQTTLSFEVKNIDKVAPVLTLNGKKNITLEAGIDTYEELGIKVTDNVDATIEAHKPKMINFTAPDGTKETWLSEVDTTRVGEYKVSYSYEDKAGNAGYDANDSRHAYIIRIVNVVDTIPPEFVTEAGYNENGINPYIKLKDNTKLSFKVYRKGTEKPIHEFDSTTVGKSFKIGWHGGGFYTIVATDAGGNTTSKEFEVYHVIDSVDDLKNAFKNGGQATLTEDITITEPIVIPEGVELVIDLNDKELNAAPTDGEQFIINKGKLTIKNGEINNDNAAAGSLIENTKTGELVLEDITTLDKATAAGAIIANDGKLTITDSNLKLSEKKIGRNVITNRGDLNISGTKITSQATKGYAITMYEGNLKIDDSNLDILSEGRGGIWIVGGKLTIDNAKINVAAGGTSYRTLYISDHEDGKDIDVTINDGEFTGYRDGIYVGHYDNFDIKLTINDGIFDINPGKNGNILNVEKAKENSENKLNISIKGGTYKNKNRGKVDTYIAEGYRLNSENKVVKENAISTQAEMVSAISEGGKFELDTDLTLTDASLKVAKNKDVEINLNGKTITARSTTSSASNAIEVLAGGNLKLTGNGKIEFTAGSPDTDWGEGGSKPYPGYASNTIVNRGTLVIDGPTIINNTEYGGATYAVDAYAGSKLTLISGEISAPYNRAIRMFTSSETPSTDVTIKGGKVTGNIPLYVHVAGSNSSVAPTVNLNISGGEIGTIDGWSLYTYSYGNSFKNINVTITGGEFYGSVAFSGGKKVDKENVSITGGTFHSDLGRYLANDGWEDIAKPAQ